LILERIYPHTSKNLPESEIKSGTAGVFPGNTRLGRVVSGVAPETHTRKLSRPTVFEMRGQRKFGHASGVRSLFLFGIRVQMIFLLYRLRKMDFGEFCLF
jgi:hypothetical protein